MWNLSRVLYYTKKVDDPLDYARALTGMDAAQHLYADAGFKALCGPLGATGHFACDRYYALDL
jgi:putative acetyltransferase